MLATGDVHLVPLRAGLGSVSVPSKTYSILAAGRPVVASIDPGTRGAPPPRRVRRRRGGGSRRCRRAARRARRLARRRAAPRRDGRRRPGLGGATRLTVGRGGRVRGAVPSAVAADRRSIARADSLSILVATSSSANKVAKLASRGKGKKVRFQGGTIFPAIVVVVVIVMLGLVAYARASRPSDGSGPPRLGDHWHAAYGFYVCDDTGASFLPNLQGTLESTTTDAAGNQVYADKDFRNTGVHSHGDGVIHYHPYTSQSTGTRARLGVFLDNYDIKLTDTKLEFPAEPGRPEVRHVVVQVRRRGHPDPRAGVGELRRHEQLPRLRHRLQEHPHRSQRHGLHHRRRAEGQGHPAAAVGAEAARARHRRRRRRRSPCRRLPDRSRERSRRAPNVRPAPSTTVEHDGDACRPRAATTTSTG